MRQGPMSGRSVLVGAYCGALVIWAVLVYVPPAGRAVQMALGGELAVPRPDRIPPMIPNVLLCVGLGALVAGLIVERRLLVAALRQRSREAAFRAVAVSGVFGEGPAVCGLLISFLVGRTRHVDVLFLASAAYLLALAIRLPGFRIADV